MEINYIEKGLKDEFKDLAPEEHNGLVEYMICCVVGGMGSGKTVAICKYLKEQCDENRISHLFVVAPNFKKQNVYKIIEDEVKDYYDDDFKPAAINEFIKGIITDCEREKNLWCEVQEIFDRDPSKFTKYILYLNEKELDGNVNDFYMTVKGHVTQRGFARDSNNDLISLWYKYPPNNYLLVDDSWGSNTLMGNKYFENLIIRNRQPAMNIIIPYQSLKGGARQSLRHVFQCWIIYFFGSEDMVKDLYEQIASGLNITFEQFLKAYILITGPENIDKDCNFFVIDRRHSKYPFRAGFNIVAKRIDELISFCESDSRFTGNQDLYNRISKEKEEEGQKPKKRRRTSLMKEYEERKDEFSLIYPNNK